LRPELPDRRWLSIWIGYDGRDEVGDFRAFVLGSDWYRIAGDGPGYRDRDACDAVLGEEELDERVGEARALRSAEPAAVPQPAVPRPGP